MAKPAPIPVFVYDEAKATIACEAFYALNRTIMREPSLLNNPLFMQLRADAYEAFRLAYDGGNS